MVILALLNDDNKKNRQKGYNFIEQYRQTKNPDDTSIRKIQKYTQDQTNLLATNYTNFIKYDNIEITEPPATFHITLEELQDIVDGKQIVNFIRKVILGQIMYKSILL